MAGVGDVIVTKRRGCRPRRLDRRLRADLPAWPTTARRSVPTADGEVSPTESSTSPSTTARRDGGRVVAAVLGPVIGPCCYEFGQDDLARSPTGCTRRSGRDRRDDRRREHSRSTCLPQCGRRSPTTVSSSMWSARAPGVTTAGSRTVSGPTSVGTRPSRRSGGICGEPPLGRARSPTARDDREADRCGRATVDPRRRGHCGHQGVRPERHRRGGRGRVHGDRRELRPGTVVQATDDRAPRRRPPPTHRLHRSSAVEQGASTRRARRPVVHDRPELDRQRRSPSAHRVPKC